MRIQTGRGYISFLSLLAIWSISALTSLPGLAISPILGQLSVVFPKATELDIQMLTSLPSFLIIPFVLLSGKLSEKTNTILLLRIGLFIFALCGILYIFSTQLWELIVVSALLGVGAGLIIPLSTGLISMFFIGDRRIKQFGFSSSISNLTLVIFTAITGYLAVINWHLPFVVYLLPIVSITLSYCLKEEDLNQIKENQKKGKDEENKWGKNELSIKSLIELMLFYGTLTFLCVIVSLNLPFLIKEYHLSSTISGIMISVFFLAMMIPGLFLNKILQIFKDNTSFYSILLVVIGLSLIVFFKNEVAMGLGAAMVGLGYGVMQPMIYERTSCISSSQKTTLALSFVMAMNYLAILVSPFIYEFFQLLIHSNSQQVPFMANMFISIILLFVAYLKKGSFVFGSQSNIKK